MRSTFPKLSDLNKGIYLAVWGTFFDVGIVAVLLVIFDAMRHRRERIERHIEEIDDYKKWDSEEARLRIAGNIRRLAKLGKTDIDFSGIVLRNFSFVSQDIDSLEGARFSTGLRLDKMSANATVLENVDFHHVNCSKVVFSRSFGDAAVLGLVGKNLSFIGAHLTHASFEGAKLSWTDYVADRSQWYVDEGEDEDGSPMLRQEYYPAFADADLKGCSFRYAALDHADFRDAENILEADFTAANGLETCFFNDDVRDRVLASAKQSAIRRRKL